MVDRDEKIHILDWGNSGCDFPALDLSRYLYQYTRRCRGGDRFENFIRLFWEYFHEFFADREEVARAAIRYQLKYSMTIVRESKNRLGHLGYAYGIYARIANSLLHRRLNAKLLK
jgi:hypothetical protein